VNLGHPHMTDRDGTTEIDCYSDLLQYRNSGDQSSATIFSIVQLHDTVSSLTFHFTVPNAITPRRCFTTIEDLDHLLETDGTGCCW
jgi:hypothetical protein